MIRVLFFAGCPNREAAIQLAQDVACSLTPPVPVDLVEITSYEQATELHFLGSPTIHVRGRDIEPGADAGSSVAFACRVYHTPEGTSGLPHREWLVDALVQAGLPRPEPGADA